MENNDGFILADPDEVKPFPEVPRNPIPVRKRYKPIIGKTEKVITMQGGFDPPQYMPNDRITLHVIGNSEVYYKMRVEEVIGVDRSKNENSNS